jgi:hypothetical protein
MTRLARGDWSERAAAHAIQAINFVGIFALPLWNMFSTI